MITDKKLFLGLFALLAIPLGIAIFAGDRFRYPCQDPKNWETEVCKHPSCDVTRTCPEHIFKGQRDPRVSAQHKDAQVCNVCQPQKVPGNAR